MSFGKKVRRTLFGEEPRVSDAEKEAADELRRVRGTGGTPGGPSPGGAAPGASPPGPAPGAGPAPPPGPSPGPPSSGPPPGRPEPGGAPPPPPGPGPSEPPGGPVPEGSGFSGSPGGGAGAAAGAAPGAELHQMTPEEEREAVTEIALQDHGGYLGGFAQEGGLEVDPAESEAMRDRALAQYLQRKEEFDRYREREAQRLAEEEAQQAFDADDGEADEPEEPAAEADAEDVEEKLSTVPGLGPAKMEALLREFGSLEELEEADEEDLVQVTGIGQQLAKGIVRALR